MSDLSGVKTMLATPEWWATALLAGLLMSVLAAYAKQGLDNLLTVSSHRWREWGTHRSQQRTFRVEGAATDVHLYVWLLARETRAKFRVIGSMVALGILWTMKGIFVLGGALLEDPLSRFFLDWMPVIFFLLATLDVWRSLHIQREQDEALRAHLARVGPAEQAQPMSKTPGAPSSTGPGVDQQ